MIYIDTSVLLAELLAEDRRPSPAVWNEPLVSSRMLEYELWTRLNAYECADTCGEAARALLRRVSLLELAPEVLERALAPFPLPVRTLDALHLASFDFLIRRRQVLRLATFDSRMRQAAEALAFAVAEV